MLVPTPNKVVVLPHEGMLSAYHVDLPFVRALGHTTLEAIEHLKEWFVIHRPDEFWGLPTRRWWWTISQDPQTLYVASIAWHDLWTIAVEDYVHQFQDVPQQVVSYCPSRIWYFPTSKIQSHASESTQAFH